jgi:hypothetical protein
MDARVTPLLAFLAFAIGAIIEAVNADDLGHAPWFWLLTGLACWALGGVLTPARRVG